jgi:hypothetical protein
MVGDRPPMALANSFDERALEDSRWYLEGAPYDQANGQRLDDAFTYALDLTVLTATFDVDAVLLSFSDGHCGSINAALLVRAGARADFRELPLSAKNLVANTPIPQPVASASAHQIQRNVRNLNFPGRRRSQCNRGRLDRVSSDRLVMGAGLAEASRRQMDIAVPQQIEADRQH